MKLVKRAVVLLSGGLDSATCLSIAINNKYDVYPLSFDYGQRHKIELICANDIVEHYNMKNYKIIKIDNFGGSALTDNSIKVPDFDQSNIEIPITYVPARNIIFLSYAVGYAEVVNADIIYIGVNAVDYSGYPDCRPAFIEAFSEVIKVGTKRGVENNSIKISTPLINLTKSEIIKLASNNKAPIHLTTSCYKGEKLACGECDSCQLRLKGFKEANLEDPINYKNNKE